MLYVGLNFQRDIVRYRSITGTRETPEEKVLHMRYKFGSINN
jgi:hypothetical protein